MNALSLDRENKENDLNRAQHGESDQDPPISQVMSRCRG